MWTNAALSDKITPVLSERATNKWRHSSAGRASASHAEGHRFEFSCLHQNHQRKMVGFSFVRRRTRLQRVRSLIQTPLSPQNNTRIQTDSGVFFLFPGLFGFCPKNVLKTFSFTQSERLEQFGRCLLLCLQKRKHRSFRFGVWWR